MRTSREQRMNTEAAIRARCSRSKRSAGVVVVEYAFLLVFFCVPVMLASAALGITMIVAIRSAKWGDVDSLETLLGFDEFEYLALFLWLAIAGAGSVSVDRWMKRFSRQARSG